MRRVLVGSLAVAAALLLGVSAGPARATGLDCDEPTALCAEPLDSIGSAHAVPRSEMHTMVLFMMVPL